MNNKSISQDKPISAVIYARFSSSNQREESITGQLRDCRSYAEKHGYKIISEYCDEAKTATSANRPQFQKMIKDSEKGLFQAVLVWKVDRFARSRYDSAIYRNKLKKNGVQVVSVMEAFSDGPEGIIMEGLMEAMAEYYSANLSENVKRGNRESMLQFKTLGKHVFGYSEDEHQHYVINPDEAPIVIKIFEDFNSGKTLTSIVNYLEGNGIKKHNQKPWSINTVSTLLKNQKYIGNYFCGDFVAEGKMPAIVGKDLFDSVQKRFKAKKKIPASGRNHPYLLTGKIFCGLCGTPMAGECGRSKNKNMYFYYACSKKKNKKACSKKNVPQDIIEDLVVEQLLSQISDAGFMEKLAESFEEYQKNDVLENVELNALEDSLKQARVKKNNVMKAIEAGIITETTMNRMTELEEEVKDLEFHIHQIKNDRPPLITKEMFLYWIEQIKAYAKNDDEYKKVLITVFLNSVYVYDDHLVIGTNLTKETETLSLEEVEKSSSLLQLSPLFKKIVLRQSFFVINRSLS